MVHNARIKCYNTQMNEVVYARVNDSVMAMKIVQYKIINNPKNGSLLHIAVFKCADGNVIEEITKNVSRKPTYFSRWMNGNKLVK